MDIRFYKCKKYKLGKPDIDCECEVCREEKKLRNEYTRNPIAGGSPQFPVPTK